MEIAIFGATGLVGGYLVTEALADKSVTEVKVFVRKAMNLQHPKLKQIITTFDTLEAVQNEIMADVVFNCLGTTLKVAGSKDAQYQIDCTYPIKVAEFAAKNGVPCMVNVSSVGAAETSNFYLKTKYDMEKGVAEAIGTKAYFLRPSFLVGDRSEFRLGEQIGIYCFAVLNWLLVGKTRKYRSVNANAVAKAMLQIAKKQPAAPRVFEYDAILEAAK